MLSFLHMVTASPAETSGLTCSKSNVCAWVESLENGGNICSILGNWLKRGKKDYFLNLSILSLLSHFWHIWGTGLIFGANFIIKPSLVGAGSSTDWTSKLIGFHTTRKMHSVPKSLGKIDDGKHTYETNSPKLLKWTISSQYCEPLKRKLQC